LALGLLPIAATAQPPAPTPPGPVGPPEPAIRAVVSIPPLKGIVQPLLPVGSTIEVLITPGVSEHGYEIPLPKLAELSRADLVVIVGLGLEPQIEKFLSQHARAGRCEVVFAKVVEDAVKAPAAPAHDHDHGDHKHEESGHVHGPECNHGPADPHLWLDPALVERLVPAVVGAIQDSYRGRASGPAGSATLGVWSRRLDEREEAMLDRLRALDAEYQRRLATCPKKSLIVAHDAWGWLAKRYGLTTIPIAGLTASEPTPKAIADVVNAAREQNLPAIFFEPQISPAAAQRVATATGLRLVRIDPLGDGDYFGLMRANLVALVDGLGGPPESAGVRGIDAKGPAKSPAGAPSR
jgi:zinc transport system substrate-binding protein